MTAIQFFGSTVLADNYYYLLDDFPGPIWAYSFRRLNRNYNGPCIDVFRESDGAIQSIGFTTDNYIDVIALNAFVGGSIGRVTTWYDQSGNGRNIAKVSSPTTCPKIIQNGVMNTLTNGKYYLPFSSSNNESLGRLNNGLATRLVDKSIFTFCKRILSNWYLVSSSTNGTNGWRALQGMYNNNPIQDFIFFNGTAYQLFGVDQSEIDETVVSLIHDADFSISMKNNGINVLNDGLLSGGSDSNSYNLNRERNIYYDMNIAEHIHYDSVVPETFRNNLVAKINEFYI